MNMLESETPGWTCRRDQFTMNILEIPQGAGSGIIWDTDGHIVTNYHVIKGASELQVRWPREISGFGYRV